MASAGAEHEQAIKDWMKSFEKLPEERQDNLKRWFATQKVIIDSTGLGVDDWFNYIQWAMDHPFDYSFIKDFPDVPETEAVSDSAERSDSTKKSRQFVGAETKTAPMAKGEGMTEKGKSDKGLERELFARFMADRLGGGRSD